MLRAQRSPALSARPPSRPDRRGGPSRPDRRGGAPTTALWWTPA